MIEYCLLLIMGFALVMTGFLLKLAKAVHRNCPPLTPPPVIYEIQLPRDDE